MRIYISADLEGIHGVDRYDNHDVKNPDYQKWKEKVRKLMYEEIIALCKGLLEQGRMELYVFDSHGSSNTLIIEDGIKNVTQVRRGHENHVHFPGLDKSCEGIIFWGYHVKSGSTTGRLAHTASRRIQSVCINQKQVGEAYVHAFYTSLYSVPLLAVSGDGGLQEEIKEDIGDIPFFNSESGNGLARNEYLASIKKFAAELEIDRSLIYGRSISWPNNSTLRITYTNPMVNLARWILRRQYRYARLVSPYGCEYRTGTIVDQWDQFSGFYRP